MGQVPESKSTNPQNNLSCIQPSNSIGIIGRGRAATHLNYYFNEIGVSVKLWHREMSEEKLLELHDCPIVLLAISDSQIENFVLEHAWLLSHELVHLSGSLVSPNIKSIHPLVSFGSKLFPLDFYKKIPLVMEKENPVEVKKYFPMVTNPIVFVPRELKPKYHALCVAANNFTTLLWQKFFKSMKDDCDISAESAKSLFDSTMLNIDEDWQGALTGPLARGDVETIARNIAALDGDELQGIYEAFVRNERKQSNYIFTYLEPGEIGL